MLTIHFLINKLSLKAYQKGTKMDETDLKIIQLLSEQGRITWAELASLLDLSRPATAERVKKLEDKGIIKGYTINIDSVSIGIDVLAFIFVTVTSSKKHDDFLKLINTLEEVQECHHISGEEDFILKVRCCTIKDLDYLIRKKLKSNEAVHKTRTNIILCSEKETSKLPLSFVKKK